MIKRSAHKNTQKAWIFLGLLVLCAVSVPAAHAENERDTANRIRRMENEIETLSRAIYKGEDPPPGAFSGGGEDVANLSVRIDQLETQIRDLTGKLEEVTYQNNQLKEQLERINSMPPSAASTPSQVYNNVPQPGPDDGIPSDMGVPYPQPSDNAGGNYQWSSDNGSGAAPAPAGTLGSVGVADEAGSMAYEAAFAYLKNGQYDAAEQGFQNFLTQYPNHALAGNAKYWLGESYYARGQFDKASRTFAEAYQLYPKGAKAPDNLLKLGLSLAGQGKKDDACVALAQVEKEFAATAGPVLKRAKEEMKNFGC